MITPRSPRWLLCSALPSKARGTTCLKRMDPSQSGLPLRQFHVLAFLVAPRAEGAQRLGKEKKPSALGPRGDLCWG